MWTRNIKMSTLANSEDLDEMLHCGQGSHRPEKFLEFDLGPVKLL